MTIPDDDGLTRRVIGAALEVHSRLRQGLLESTYEQCLSLELNEACIPFSRQTYLPIRYKSTVIEKAYKVDFLISNELIVEIKSIEAVLPIHRAQVRTYLIHAGLKRGLLFNFNVESLKSGIYRVSV